MTSYDYGLANPPEAAGKSGKELLRAIIDGRLPQATESAGGTKFNHNRAARLLAGVFNNKRCDCDVGAS